MSTPAIQYSGPTISPDVDFEVRRHLQLFYQKLGNHTQAFALLQKQIAAIKAGSTTTNIQTIAGSSSGGIASSNIGVVDDQAGETAVTPMAGDYGALIVLSDASAVAVTLIAQDVPWFSFLLNEGAGTATITPASGTINGNSSLALATGYGAVCFFDGEDWWALVAAPASGGYTPQGGPTGSRPGSPTLYQVYFDTTLTQPVWWTGTAWVNAAGVTT